VRSPEKSPWTQIIPTKWGAIPLKHLSSIDNSGSWGNEPDDCENPIPVLRTADFDMFGNINVDHAQLRCLGDDLQLRYCCRPGDILVVKSSGSATNVITGKAVLVKGSEGKIAFSNFLLRIQPDTLRIAPQFLFYFLTSSIIREQILLMVSTTTYPNLKVGEYISFKVPLPSMDDQHRVTDYLDREITQIDGLIGQKERMLGLLEEKRAALISRAVTRGLDPDAPLKPSGYPWLSDTPAHWKVKRSKQVLKERDERSITGGEELLTVSHITGVTKRSEKEVYMFEAETNEGYKRCSPGNLVINTLWAWMGAMGIAWEAGIVSPAYHVYKLSPERLPVPPLKEQQQIIDAIVSERQQTAEMEAVLNKSIELLKERRSALITAAVTGQLNISGEAA